jgi:hypothetical protein
MRWSQLKRRIEERFADAVRGRVALHQTVYHRAPDGFGEFWLTIDGERRFVWGDVGQWRERAAVRAAVTPDPALSAPEVHWDVWHRQDEALEAAGVLSRSLINRRLFASLSFPIARALKDPNPLIRGLAVLDARCGARRLPALAPHETHPFVRAMLALRAGAGAVAPARARRARAVR